MDISTLQQFGLDESEAAVYMALLQIGAASVSQMTKKAGMTRTLGYHVVDKLVAKELIDEVVSTKKKIYKVKHPTYLKRYVAKQKKHWEIKLEDLDTLLPEFVQLYTTDNKPTIRYQEGVRGLISLYEEKFQSKTDILSVLDVESWKTPELWDWVQEYHVRRKRSKVSERILLLDTPEGRRWINEYKGVPKYTTYRWVSTAYAKQLLQYGGGIDIYDQSVMISLLDTPKKTGMIIEGGILSNVLRAMFELAWQSAEPVNFER
jgi:sugar-specific transcriptional regulator TrmB